MHEVNAITNSQLQARKTQVSTISYADKKNGQDVSFGIIGLDALGIAPLYQTIGVSGVLGWLIGRTKHGKPSQVTEFFGKVLRSPINLFKNIFMGKKQ